MLGFFRKNKRHLSKLSRTIPHSKGEIGAPPPLIVTLQTLWWNGSTRLQKMRRTEPGSVIWQFEGPVHNSGYVPKIF